MSHLKQYFPIAEAITLLLYPHAEVVVHNLRTGKIAAIYNDLSKRKVGDDSLIEHLDSHSEFPNVFPVYTKINWDGRNVKSSTATLRDKNGKPIGLLCINLDISRWEEFRGFLDQWLNTQKEQSPSVILFKNDWREKINLYVSEYLKKEKTTLKRLDKEKKKELVHALYKEGAFEAKNAAQYVAEVLNLSRATIYNYIKVIL